MKMSEEYGQIKGTDVAMSNFQVAGRMSLAEPPISAEMRNRWAGLLQEEAEAAAARTVVSLSLVLPCYNEELNIANTIRSAQEWFSQAHIDGEIIVTNDGSADGSLALLRKLQTEMPNLKVVNHEKNQGYGAAIRSGCDQAEKTWIAFMDSDGQFHSKDIGRLLKQATKADYVTGIRERRADTLPRKLNSFMYRTLVRVLLGVHPTDLNCGMKLFRRSIWKTIRPVYATGALINGEMFFALKNSNIAWEEAVVPHYPRVAGKPTGAKPRVILKMFLELWRLKRAMQPAQQCEEPELSAAQA